MNNKLVIFAKNISITVDNCRSLENSSKYCIFDVSIILKLINVINVIKVH